MIAIPLFVIAIQLILIAWLLGTFLERIAVALEKIENP